jgi:hypothetical protein
MSITKIHADIENGVALRALNFIEADIRTGMKDSAEKLFRIQIAELFYCQYRNEITNFPFFTQLFFGIHQQQRKVQEVYNRIEKLGAPPLILDLPSELIEHIYSFLHTRDMGRSAQVNKHAEVLSKHALHLRARVYGYKGDDPAGAKEYIQNLFEAVDVLVSHDRIPKEYVVYRGMWPFFHYVDSEATLKNLRDSSSEKKKRLEAHFSRVLRTYVMKEKVEIVKALLVCGVDPNGRNHLGRTPLQIAVRNQNKELVIWLLYHGANPNIADCNGFTPLCTHTGSHEITRWLAEKGADVDHRTLLNGYSALHFAAERGQLETAKVLLKHGADPYIRSNSGETPLEIAQRKRNKNLISLLLNHGIDPHRADN